MSEALEDLAPAAAPVQDPHPARPLWPALLAAPLAGGLLALAFPSTDLWFLAPFGVAVLALCARGRTARQGFVLGLLTGLAFFLPHLEWTGIYVGALPWTALAVLESLFVGLLGAVLPLAWRAPGGRAGTVAAVAGLWVAQEALRGRVPFGGLPWGRLAFSQADSPALGLAWLGGAPLVSFAVAASGGLLAVAAVEAGRRRTTAAALAVLTVVPLLAGAAAGALAATTTSSRSVQVAAVQGNVPRAGLDFNAERRAVLDNHASTTTRYMAAVARGEQPPPDLVLWPENASDIDPLANADAYAVIQRAADSAGVPLLVGAVLRDGEENLNAGIVWHPSTAVRPGPGEQYVKRHPAPFGEYIPYRSFFRMISDKVDLVARDFAAGDRVGAMRMGPAVVGDVICFEVAYDTLVTDPVRAGADLLVVQTNNATFGRSDESVQQLAMSRLRAVETGRAVAHVSTVGISGLVLPDGSLVARSGHFTQEVLAARLPLRTDLTPAVRLHQAPEAVLALLGVGLVGAAGLRARRAARRIAEQAP